jgi:hypothetical protein
LCVTGIVWETGDIMEWFKKHIDSIAIIFSIITTMIGAMIWLNGKFNTLEKDILVIKTVLVMKNIMPSGIASKEN